MNVKHALSDEMPGGACFLREKAVKRTLGWPSGEIRIYRLPEGHSEKIYKTGYGINCCFAADAGL